MKKLIIKFNHFYVDYFEIVKKSKNKDPFGGFMIKIYDENKKFTNVYSHVGDWIFQNPDIVKYTKKFNPEKLI